MFNDDLYTNNNTGLWMNGEANYSGAGITSRDSGLSLGIFGGGSERLRIKNTGEIFIYVEPTTSAGTYDILTRNTSTGVVEKVLSNTIAMIASPAFTGTPTAPTATAGTNTNQIATTAFVLANSSSGTYTPTLTNTTNIFAR